MALGVVVIAQIMILLDATVMNVALPSAQADLGFSDANQQWVITAYVLAFGSLLPLGGRLADGRRCHMRCLDPRRHQPSPRGRPARASRRNRQRPDLTTRCARRRLVAADHARTTEGDIDA
jgi:MFS family permease